MPAFVDRRGHQFGRLTVLDRAPNRGRRVYWRVRCDCGEERIVQSGSLRSGNTRSCGCLQVEVVRADPPARTHGLRGTPEYRALNDARRRCTNPSDAGYSNYGGRGIEYRLPLAIGEATALLIDAIGRRPNGRSLDRIDNDSHYQLGNLRWATRSEQNRNQRQRARHAQPRAS